jgi:hypothetical protein
VTDHPDLVTELIDTLKQLGCIPEAFVFSSIQVNHNPIVKKHVDKNGGMSIALSFGSFTGGILMVDDKPVDIVRNEIIFDGSIEHWVTPHEGDRWSLVIFFHNKANTLSSEQQLILRKVGFNLGNGLNQALQHEASLKSGVSVVERGNFPCQKPLKQGLALHEQEVLMADGLYLPARKTTFWRKDAVQMNQPNLQLSTGITT